MATLLEIYTIEANSQADPVGADAPTLAAIQLRQKVRTAVIKRANTVMQTALPADATRGDALEVLAWAQKAVLNPDTSAMTVFRLILAANAAATSATILAASDTAIENALGPVLALLSKGLAVGGR